MRIELVSLQQWADSNACVRVCSHQVEGSGFRVYEVLLHGISQHRGFSSNKWDLWGLSGDISRWQV